MKAIYIITPSWLMKKKKEFLAGVKKLEQLGFKVLNPGVPTRLPSIPLKVKQLHNAFLNQRADIILAQRGGYSSMKLLPRLDFRLIKNNPKIFAGFSDLTTLLNAIYERTGLVTLHAPMVINFPNPTPLTVRSFLNAIHDFPERNLLAGAPVQVLKPGMARGILKGGNLKTLTALIGTAWEIATDGVILFLEDVDEKEHEVNRCLTQWILAGKLARIKGLILGDFQGLRHQAILRILREQIKISFPVAGCSYIGHRKNKLTLPVGARVELDTSKKSLTLR